MADSSVPYNSRDTLVHEIRGVNLTGNTSVHFEFRNPTATAGVIAGSASATLEVASGTGANAYSETHCAATAWQAIVTSSGTYQERTRADYASGPSWYSRWRTRQFLD